LTNAVSFNAGAFACFFTAGCTCALTAVIPTDKVSENTSLFRKAMILYFYKNKTFETILYKKTTLLLVPLKWQQVAIIPLRKLLCILM
jgi:hypothetical protein